MVALQPIIWVKVNATDQMSFRTVSNLPSLIGTLPMRYASREAGLRYSRRLISIIVAGTHSSRWNRPGTRQPPFLGRQLPPNSLPQGVVGIDRAHSECRVWFLAVVGIALQINDHAANRILVGNRLPVKTVSVPRARAVNFASPGGQDVSPCV